MSPVSPVWMVLAAGLVASAVPAAADEAVTVGGALALLNKPSAPRVAVVLISGGDGVLGVALMARLPAYRATSSCAPARPTCAAASRP